VLLAAYAGLRCIEISRLDREHVTEHTITVAGKGDQAGTVPTHPHIWAAVRHLPPGPLVLDRHGRRMRERTLSTRFSHYARLKLGLPVSMHQMRHWAGTECQRAVGDVRVTQEFLRHESITSTMIYTQVSDRQLVAAVNSLPTIGAGPNGASPPDAPAAGPTPPPPAD
jgi:integrase/recombinase XerC